MTIAQLIRYAEENGLDPETTEVRFMGQPEWPFEHSIGGIIDTDRLAGEDTDFEPTKQWGAYEAAAVMYLTEGRQLGYGSRVAFDVAEDPRHFERERY